MTPDISQDGKYTTGKGETLRNQIKRLAGAGMSGGDIAKYLQGDGQDLIAIGEALKQEGFGAFIQQWTRDSFALQVSSDLIPKGMPLEMAIFFGLTTLQTIVNEPPEGGKPTTIIDG